jgi:hypothetical protein
MVLKECIRGRRKSSQLPHLLHSIPYKVGHAHPLTSLNSIRNPEPTHYKEPSKKLMHFYIQFFSEYSFPSHINKSYI